MSDLRIILCKKLGKEMPGLKVAPLPGELGKKIYETISAEAWQLWLKQQTMFINEYRLNLTDTEARKFLREQMEDFLFNDIERKPEGYVPTE
jgi:Fe-S cluster biosynthesis and repair protein YggX